jgi:methylenetetrahydrofolate reductase (NADPH)
MKIKINHGGEFIITQLFFDNSIYSEYLDRLNLEGINVRVIPGILPITSYEGLLKFRELCGATITPEVHEIFKPISNDKEATRKAGIEFAVKQCQDLLERGAPGLHFFTIHESPGRERREKHEAVRSKQKRYNEAGKSVRIKLGSYCLKG